MVLPASSTRFFCQELVLLARQNEQFCRNQQTDDFRWNVISVLWRLNCPDHWRSHVKCFIVSNQSWPVSLNVLKNVQHLWASARIVRIKKLGSFPLYGNSSFEYTFSEFSDNCRKNHEERFCQQWKRFNIS